MAKDSDASRKAFHQASDDDLTMATGGYTYDWKTAGDISGAYARKKTEEEGGGLFSHAWNTLKGGFVSQDEKRKYLGLD